MNLMTLVYSIAPLIGLVTLLIGIMAILQPQAMSKKFGISVDGKALPYVVSTGVRDVFIGLTVLVLYYRQEFVSLGAINLCIGIVAISDFLVVRTHGDKKVSLLHLFGAVLVIIYGICLIKSH